MNYRYILSFLLCIPLADIFGGVDNASQLNPKKYSFQFTQSSKTILNYDDDDEGDDDDEENGFDTETRKLVIDAVNSQVFGSFIVVWHMRSLLAIQEQVKYWSAQRSQFKFKLNKTLVSPFIKVTHFLLNFDGEDSWNDITAYTGLDMDIANLKADTYSIDTRLLAKASYSLKNWSSEDIKLTGSIEWTASLNLNSGVSFSSSLDIDTDGWFFTGLTVRLKH